VAGTGSALALGDASQSVGVWLRFLCLWMVGACGRASVCRALLSKHCAAVINNFRRGMNFILTLDNSFF